MADPQFKTFSYTLANKGLVARYVSDVLPEGAFFDLTGLESRQENGLFSRFGNTAINVDDPGQQNLPLGDPDIHTLARMKALNDELSNAPVTYRYAGAGQNLYRREGDARGAFTKINGPNQLFSGNPFSVTEYRPNLNSNPFTFFADSQGMYKDNGTLSPLYRTGILPPLGPPLTSIADPERVVGDDFEEPPFGTAALANYTFSNVSAPHFIGRIGGATSQGIHTPGLQHVNVGSVIQSIARNGAGTVSTVQTVANHGFFPGTVVRIRGAAAGKLFNVSAATVQSVPTPKSFTYNNPGVALQTSGNQGITDSLPSIMPGCLLVIEATFANEESVEVLTVDTTGFTAHFNKTHGIGVDYTSIALGGTVAAGTTGTITKKDELDFAKSVDGFATFGPTDLINLYVLLTAPQNVTEVRVQFDVGDGTFTSDYYTKSITPNISTPAVSGQQSAASTFSTGLFTRASGGIDVRLNRATDLLPTDVPQLQGLRSAQLNNGALRWTRFLVQQQQFLAVGNAGNPGQDWSSIVAWRVVFVTGPGSTIVGLDDLYVTGGNGPDVTGGIPYDYKTTFYDANTGTESNPSITQASYTYVSPVRQPIQVIGSSFTGSPPDPQVTHYRIYRRGGTLPVGWLLVGSVPVADFDPLTNTFTFIDTVPDSVLQASAPTLQIDNDVPVTSALRVPMSATLQTAVTVVGFQLVTLDNVTNMFPYQDVSVGEGANQENVRVISLPPGTNNFYGVFQYVHDIGEPVTCNVRVNRPLNLSAVAFDRMWLAGDPDNPHILYYSKRFNPEAYPPQNTLEIGTPKDPIMALVELKGVLYVFTLTRIYQVLAIGGATPNPTPTGVKHGLVANFGWAISEDRVFYLSYDGVYMFTGQRSDYMTEQTEWVWQNERLGPITPLDPANKNTVTMMYGQHELFVAYTDTTQTRRRMIFHDVYNRWRPDDVPVTAQLFEEDSATFLIGRTDAPGMVFQDRVGDADNFGWTSDPVLNIQVPDFRPINYRLQTPQLDQGSEKAFKQYQELTIDCNTNGQNVSVVLLFDNGENSVVLANLNTGNRAQVQLNIVEAFGEKSQNVGLVLLGQATKVVSLYKVHIRATIEAEYRQSYDSYWTKWGTDQFKVVKQGWFEYIAPDSAGIQVEAYIEGSTTNVRYSFNLPQATQRTSRRVRLPAVKAKLWRFIATSNADFQFYDESHFEVRIVGNPNGFEKKKLNA